MDDILTIFSIISNFAMAVATVLMALYSKKSIDEMKISRKEANKANIVFYVEQKEHNLNFIIKNIGNSMAKNVKIRSNPQLKYDDEFNFDSIFKNIVPSFPPGFEIKFAFNDTISILNESDSLSYTISISFEDIYGEIVKEDFIIDLSYLNNLFLKIPNDVDSSLHNINKNMEKIIKSNDSNMDKLINFFKKND